MLTPATLDFDAMVAAIPGEQPSGQWLPDVHGAIGQARRADDDLPKGEWKREAKSADWRGVIKIAIEALATRTKDLKTAAFLVEALVKEHGLAGARDGLRLLRVLQENFWESLHPQIEDGDLEGRIAPIEWLNGKLATSLKEIALTRSRDGRAYTYLQWEESRAVERLKAEERDTAIAEGKLSGEQFDKAVAATPRAFYEGVVEDLDSAADELKALERVIDEKFRRDAPGLLDVRKTLEQCRDVVQPIVKRKRELEPGATPTGPQAAAVAAEANDGAGVGASGSPGPIDPANRADALRRLSAVATFFRRTEPHSPVAYLVERAAQWGKMPLEQWLQEVIHDEAVLGRVRETLGLTGPADSQGEGSSEHDGPTQR